MTTTGAVPKRRLLAALRESGVELTYKGDWIADFGGTHFRFGLRHHDLGPVQVGRLLRRLELAGVPTDGLRRRLEGRLKGRRS